MIYKHIKHSSVYKIFIAYISFVCFVFAVYFSFFKIENVVSQTAPSISVPKNAFDSIEKLTKYPTAYFGSMKIDVLGYSLEKIYYDNGVDYYSCNSSGGADIYCDDTNNSLTCKDYLSRCNEKQVFKFQDAKKESFYKRSPGEKIIRLVKTYSDNKKIITDYRISYLPPYNNNFVTKSSSTAFSNFPTPSYNTDAPKVSADLFFETGSDIVTNARRVYSVNSKLSNLPKCKKGASLADIGNTCMLEIYIPDIPSTLPANYQVTSNIQDYCHEITAADPVLGLNCRLPSCLAIEKQYFRRPGINCLADCNAPAGQLSAVVANIFNPGGIDDERLKYPGINCLPACDTNSLGVDSYKNTNFIGDKCFLRHNGYVMPVCDSSILGATSGVIKNSAIATVKSGNLMPRKDCLNPNHLPLCIFFKPSERASSAQNFSCLGSYKIDTQSGYYLGLLSCVAGDCINYSHNKITAIPNKPFYHNYFIQSASLLSDTDYVKNVDNALISEDIFAHDEYDEANSNSIRKPENRYKTTTRNTDQNSSLFNIDNSKYKIKNTTNLYSDRDQSCLLLSPQELKFIGERNCDLNQIWSDTNGGENNIANSGNSDTNKNKFCQGQYFCKVDARCSEFTNEQLKEAKAFFHCLPPQYTSYNAKKATDEVKCDRLNDIEILSLSNNSYDSSADVITGVKKSIPQELDNYVNKACFRGNISFLIHKRQDHNTVVLPLDLNDPKSQLNLPSISSSSAKFFDDPNSNYNLSNISLPEVCQYQNNPSYRFASHNLQCPNQNSTQQCPECLHSTQFNCIYDNFKKGCYILNRYLYNSNLLNWHFTDRYSQVLSNIADDNIFTNKDLKNNDAVSIINNTLNNLGKLNCFTNETIENSFNPKFSVGTDILKCNSQPFLFSVFSNAPLRPGEDDNVSRLLYKKDPEIDILQDCYDCYCTDPLKTNTEESFKDSENEFIKIGNKQYFYQNLVHVMQNAPNGGGFYCKSNDTWSMGVKDCDSDDRKSDDRKSDDGKSDDGKSDDGKSDDRKSKYDGIKYLDSSSLHFSFQKSSTSLPSDAEYPCISGECRICYKINPSPALINKNDIKKYPAFKNLNQVCIENCNPTGYDSYEDPYYSWFFFPTPPQSSTNSKTNVIRNCGTGKCYKEFTVDFPNVSKYKNSSGSEISLGRRDSVDFRDFAPIYYYGNGYFGDDADKKKYNLVSSNRGLDMGVVDRSGIHSINKITSPAITAVRGASTMSDNAYGLYNDNTSFDRTFLCGDLDKADKKINEDSFAYFAPIKTNRDTGIKGNTNLPYRYTFADYVYNSNTGKIEYVVNICLRYENLLERGACGRRECKMNNPPGTLYCGNDQCRTFYVEEVGSNEYSKCHLLHKFIDHDGRSQPAWFLGDLNLTNANSDKTFGTNDEKDKDPQDNSENYLDIFGVGQYISNYHNCAKLYSDPRISLAFGTYQSYHHRVRAFHDKSGYICAEIDFYGVNQAVYDSQGFFNASGDGYNDYEDSAFIVLDGKKICYGGRIFNKNTQKCGFFNQFQSKSQSFDTFTHQNQIGYIQTPGSLIKTPDPSVWRVMGRVKFVSKIINSDNKTFYGYSIPDVEASGPTEENYANDLNITNLFPNSLDNGEKGIITMVYDHDARISKIGNIDINKIYDGSNRNREDDAHKDSSDADNKKYGLLQASKGMKNPYYGFNGYDKDAKGNWRSTSVAGDNPSGDMSNPAQWNICYWGVRCHSIVTSRKGKCQAGSCSHYGNSTYNTDGDPSRLCPNQSGTPSGCESNGNKELSKTVNKDFMPNNFLQEKIWLKSHCVKTPKRLGPLPMHQVANVDNSPNLFNKGVTVVGLQAIKKRVGITWIDVDDSSKWSFVYPGIVSSYQNANDLKMSFTDPQLLLQFGSNFYHIKLPQQQSIYAKCLETESSNKFPKNDNDDINIIKFNPAFTFSAIRDEIKDSDANLKNSQIFASQPTTNHYQTIDQLNTYCSAKTPSAKPYGIILESDFSSPASPTKKIRSHILIRKEYSGDVPNICVYQAEMIDEDKPKFIEKEQDLKIIGCYNREDPEIAKMNLVADDRSAGADSYKKHQVKFQYKYNPSSNSYVDVATIVNIDASSDFSYLDNVDDSFTKDFYFEGYKMSVDRHKCTALNIECVDNEKAIQETCGNKQLLCSPSIGTTYDDIYGFNSSIGASTDNLDILGNLKTNFETRARCKVLLKDCNNLNGINTSVDYDQDITLSMFHPIKNNTKYRHHLGWQNKVCLGKQVKRLIANSYIRQYNPIKLTASKCDETNCDSVDFINRDSNKFGQVVNPDNFNNIDECRNGITNKQSCRQTMIWEYANNLCANIGHFTNVLNYRDQSRDLVEFCQPVFHQTINKNLEVFFDKTKKNVKELTALVNLQFKSLKGDGYANNSSATEGVDESHKNRSANPEYDINYVGDNNIYRLCNGFWKYNQIDNSKKYQCQLSESDASRVNISGSTDETCARYQCLAKKFQSDTFDEPNINGVYNPPKSCTNCSDIFYSFNDVQNIGYAIWDAETKTNDFIEEISASKCLVGFKESNLDDISNNVGDVKINTEFINKITDESSRNMIKSAIDNGVSHLYINSQGASPIKPTTQCNQFGYWRFDWNQDQREVIDSKIYSKDDKVKNSCERIECPITDLRTALSNTPIRLVKEFCDDTSGTKIITSYVNKQTTLNDVNNYYYYLKLNNAKGCFNSDNFVLKIKKSDGTDLSEITSSSAQQINNNTAEIYFKISGGIITEFARKDIDLSGNANYYPDNNNNYEKILYIWKRIAGFVPDGQKQSDVNNKIYAARNRNDNHFIVNEKDRYITNDSGICLAKMGYKTLTNNNPKLLCTHLGKLQVKVPCVASCEIPDSTNSNSEEHGYSIWGIAGDEKDNNILSCNDYVNNNSLLCPSTHSLTNATTLASSRIVDSDSCIDKKSYPYPPFRTLEGVKYYLYSGTSFIDISSRTHSQVEDVYISSATLTDSSFIKFDQTNLSANIKINDKQITKQDSIGALDEELAPFDIIPGAVYFYKEINSANSYIKLVANQYIQDDIRMLEYNLAKRKDCTLPSLSGNDYNVTSCNPSNINNGISDGVMVEFNTAPENNKNIYFTITEDNTSRVSDKIQVSNGSQSKILQYKKNYNSKGDAWVGIQDVGNSLSLYYSNNKKYSNQLQKSKTQTINISLSCNSGGKKHNCSSGVNINVNQEQKVSFSNFPTTDIEKIVSINLTDNETRNVYPLKKIDSQGNLLNEFQVGDIKNVTPSSYTIRATDTDNDNIINYYLLIDKDFNDSAKNYPTPHRTCRYALGNVWSLPDSECQNYCPGNDTAVNSSSATPTRTPTNIFADYLASNNKDNRLGVAITEHWIDATGYNGLTVGQVLSSDDGSKIIVKVVAINSDKAKIHVLWPHSDYGEEHVLVLKKDGDKYKVMVNLDAEKYSKTDPTQDPTKIKTDDSITKPITAAHYEGNGVKDWIILYRRCQDDGRWLDPISLCPINGPIKGYDSASSLYTVNSILGFVDNNSVSPYFSSLRSTIDIQQKNGNLTRLESKYVSIFDHSSSWTNFFAQPSQVDESDSSGSLNKMAIRFIPDYKAIIGNDFKVKDPNPKVKDPNPLLSINKNKYAYAMCNYNYSNGQVAHYNFYNSDATSSGTQRYGNNIAYQCQYQEQQLYQDGNKFYPLLNRYKIDRTVADANKYCQQKCNSEAFNFYVKPGKGSTDSYVKTPSNNKDAFFSDVQQNSISAGASCYDGTTQKSEKIYNKDAVCTFYKNDQNSLNIYADIATVNPDFSKNCSSLSSSGTCNINGYNNQCNISSTSNLKVTFYNNGTKQNINYNSNAKYCWGIKQDFKPKATCMADGAWNLANSYKSFKEVYTDVIRVDEVVWQGSQIGTRAFESDVNLFEIILFYGNVVTRDNPGSVDKGEEEMYERTYTRSGSGFSNGEFDIFRIRANKYDQSNDYKQSDDKSWRARNDDKWLCPNNPDTVPCRSGKVFVPTRIFDSINLWHNRIYKKSDIIFHEICQTAVLKSETALLPGDCKGFCFNEMVDGYHILSINNFNLDPVPGQKKDFRFIFKACPEGYSPANNRCEVVNP